MDHIPDVSSFVVSKIGNNQGLPIANIIVFDKSNFSNFKWIILYKKTENNGYVAQFFKLIGSVCRTWESET